MLGVVAVSASRRSWLDGAKAGERVVRAAVFLPWAPGRGAFVSRPNWNGYDLDFSRRQVAGSDGGCGHCRRRTRALSSLIFQSRDDDMPKPAPGVAAELRMSCTARGYRNGR